MGHFTVFLSFFKYRVYGVCSGILQNGIRYVDGTGYLCTALYVSLRKYQYQFLFRSSRALNLSDDCEQLESEIDVFEVELHTLKEEISELDEEIEEEEREIEGLEEEYDEVEKGVQELVELLDEHKVRNK